MNYRHRPLLSLGLVLFASLALVSHSDAYALIDLDIGGSAGASSSGVVQASSSAHVESSTTSASTTSSTKTAVAVDMAPEKVETDSDLEAYVATALRSDESLDDVSFSEDSVTVTYKERGRLLALVPMTFTVRALAHADGTVELNYPWYSFLTLDDQDEIETDLRIAVDNAIRAHALGSVRAEGESEHLALSASERATIAAEMHTILKARLEEKGF